MTDAVTFDDLIPIANQLRGAPKDVASIYQMVANGAPPPSWALNYNGTEPPAGLKTPPPLAQAQPVDFSDLIPASPDAKQEIAGPPSPPGVWDAIRAVASKVPGMSLAPDIAYGASQVPLAAAQMISRLPLGYQGAAPAIDKGIGDYAGSYNAAVPSGAGAAPAIGRSIGQGLITGPLGGGMGAAKGFLGLLGQGAGTGALTDLLTPIEQPGADFWSQKAKDAGTGAAFGAGAGGLLGAVGSVLRPYTSAAVQTLVDAGVSPTIGQTLGGTAKRIEEMASSIPVLGDVIKSAQGRAVAGFNRAIYQRTLAPVVGDDAAAAAAAAAPVGNAGVAKVGDALSSAYDAVLGQIPVFKTDAQLMGELSAIKTGSGLPPDRAQQFSDILAAKLPLGAMSGQTMKDAESALGAQVRNYVGSSDADQRALGYALRDAQAALRDAVARQYPNVAPVLQAVNQGWANLTQLETAAARVGAKDGVVTPAQYLSAVKQSDTSVRDRAFARGQVRNQDLAQAGDAVLSAKLGESGTAPRGILAAGLGALATGGLSSINPLAGAGAIAAMLPYTPWGQKAAAYALTQRPAPIGLLGNWIKSMVPYAGASAPGVLGAAPAGLLAGP